MLKDGKLAGVSTWVGYSSNERKHADAGDTRAGVRRAGHPGHVRVGRANGGSAKPTVERHKQVEIRATVSPVPYVEVVRTNYADGGWRETGNL